MKKDRLLLSFLILVIGCLNFNSAALTYEEYAKNAASRLTQKAMDAVSPLSGKDGWYRIDPSSISVNGSYMKCEATLGWTEWNIWDGYRYCQAWGTIYANTVTGEEVFDVSSINKDLEKAVNSLQRMKALMNYGLEHLNE